jgi:hypothetical protein
VRNPLKISGLGKSINICEQKLLALNISQAPFSPKKTDDLIRNPLKISGLGKNINICEQKLLALNISQTPFSPKKRMI